MQDFIKFLLIPMLIGATKYAGEFQELGVNARAWAMGSTGVAQCVDASALYFNPAGTIFAGRSVAVMHAENFGGIVKNEFGAITLPKGNSAVGLGLQYVSAGGIKLTTLPDTTMPPGSDNPPVAYDTVAARDLIVYFNGARSKGPVSYGVTAKVYYRDLYVITGFGGGLDAGARLDLGYLVIGCSVRDVVLSPIVWSNRTKENIAPKLAFGVAPVLPLDRISSRLIIETDIVKAIDDNGFAVNIGCEYGYKELVFGRIGWTRGTYTLGAGIRYRKLRFDYAFVTHSDLENSNKFSAGLEF
ncbi:MAG TPA: hypothetical protein VF399_00670 [bacterium]|jgi:hypothetical protein